MIDGRSGASPTIVTDGAAVADEGARLFVASARDAIAHRGVFRVALSGGNTPRAMYQKLAAPPYRDQVDWPSVQVFFSDERFVPPDAVESNYHTAKEELLSKVPLQDRFVHPYATVDTEPAVSASLYEEDIKRIFQTGRSEVPAFDLTFLGLGSDGHTASLFPGTEALNIVDRLVAANHVPKLDAWRLTFTYRLLNAARRVAFLVQGKDKADTVAMVMSGQSDPPAARVRPTNGELLWIIDRSAAGRIDEDRSARLDDAPVHLVEREE